jgi:hypothetical protein
MTRWIPEGRGAIGMFRFAQHDNGDLKSRRTGKDGTLHYFSFDHPLLNAQQVKLLHHRLPETLKL